MGRGVGERATGPARDLHPPEGGRPARRSTQPAIEAIVAGRHGDPFAVLGVHEVGRRARRPRLRRRRRRARGLHPRRRAGRRARPAPRRRLLRGAAHDRQPPAAQVPRPQRRRRVVGRRPLLLRAGARADGRLLHPRGHATCGSSTRWARTRSTTRAPTACTSRSGRRTPAGSASSATSTPGTAGATSCGCAATPASGRSSSPGSRRALAYKFEIIGPDGEPPAAEGRPLRPRLRAPPRHRLDRRARARPRLGRRRAPRALEQRRRPAPADLDLRGAPRLVAARRRAASSPGTRWPTG